VDKLFPLTHNAFFCYSPRLKASSYHFTDRMRPDEFGPGGSCTAGHRLERRFHTPRLAWGVGIFGNHIRPAKD
jgi:hypothetical protein